MIKVLHVTFDMRIGGTEQVIKNIIQGSDKNKLDMSVLCIESPLGPFAQELLDDGIVFHQLNRKPRFDYSLIKSIRSIIKTNQIDILHCHQYTPWVYGALAAAFSNTKVIFTEHGRFYPDSSSLKRKLINPILNLFTNKITTISKATKQALIDYEFLPANKIDVIYNGIKPLEVNQEEVKQLRKQLNIDDETFTLGTVARLDPIKNHKMMLNAFKLILAKQPNTKLIIVGDGEEKENIESLITELNIKDEVILTGFIQQPKNYIALMDVYLLSSFSEGTSMTLLEAMSLGKPCVVTDVGGNPEVIFHKHNGMICDNDNSLAFSNSIIKIPNDNLFYKHIQLNAKVIFDEKFINSKMLKSYQKLYFKV
ncbi:MAG: glycosyltransferase [Thalassotalea sp.]|nr:glycosyltransferase [Thalassotalea sp.]